MATLSPSAKQVFLSNLGQPAAGYLLYTYQTGTSTPLATYSDKAGTVPNANPITLDARGEAILYLQAKQYRYELRDSLGSVVWTRDNVSPQADAADLAATGDSVGSSLLGFIQGGAGSIPRTVQDKLRDLPSVEDFGAKGDGVTNDSAAFTAMLNQVGFIRLLKKTYYVGTTFAPPARSSLFIFGAGKPNPNSSKTGL